MRHKTMENSISQERCKKCKLCIEVCPCNIIGVNKDGDVSFIPERISICLHCGQCMAICTTKAINVNTLSYDNDFIDLPENNIDFQNYINFLSNRRSIRNFKQNPISNEIIQNILESISYAPFGSEPQKVNIAVINNRKTIESALPYIADFLEI